MSTAFHSHRHGSPEVPCRADGTPWRCFEATRSAGINRPLQACLHPSMKIDVPIDRQGALFPNEQSRNPKRRHALRQEGRVLLAFRKAEIAPQARPEGGKDPTNEMLLALRRRRRIFVNLIPALRTERARIGRLNIPRPAPSARSDDSHAPAERSEHVPLRHLPVRK